MNNPEEMFGSPIRAAAPPSKKQRAGSTPGSRSRGSGPPTTTSSTNIAPPMASSSSQSASSNIDDGIARRRAELRRLQGLKSGDAGSQPPRVASNRPQPASTQELLAKARSQLDPSKPPPTMASGPPKQAFDPAKGPPKMASSAMLDPSRGPPIGMGPPPATGLERVRNSDIFPTVPKAPAPAPGPTPVIFRPSAPAPAPVATDSAASGPAAKATAPPAQKKQQSSSSAQNRSATAPPRRPEATDKPGPPPPPKTTQAPPVARKLDTSFATETPPLVSESKPAAAVAAAAAPRSKSAPPRPPPPPPPPPPKRGGPNTSKTATKSTAASTPSGPPPMKDRTQTPRPAPVSPKSLLMQQNVATTSAPLPPTTTSASTSSKSDKSSGIPPKTPSAPPMTASTPSSERRDKIRAFRDAVDTPPSKKETTKETIDEPPKEAVSEIPHSLSAKQLEDALKHSHEEKEAALKQIFSLERQLAEYEQAEIDKNMPPTIKKMVELSEAEGEQAALDWIKSQLGDDGAQPKAAFLSPMAGIPPTSPAAAMTPDGGMAGTPAQGGMASVIRKRRATPHPKLPRGNENDETPIHPVEIERKYHRFFIEAANDVPFEYYSEEDNVTYLVRRPYGMETAPDLFAACSLKSPDAYGRKAHSSNSSSIEVAAIIPADDSLFLLSTQSIRHGRRNSDTGALEWKEWDIEEFKSNPLPVVSYIGANANEQIYHLDDVYDGAIQTREQYCASLTNRALGLKSQPPQQPPQEVEKVIEKVVEQAPKPETMNVAVDTSDLVVPPSSVNVPEKNKPKAEPAQQKSKKSAPVEEDVGSSNVLVLFFGMIFSLIVGIIWTIFVKIPLRVLSFTLTLTLTMALISIIYMFILEENGHAVSMSAVYQPSNYNLGGIR